VAEAVEHLPQTQSPEFKPQNQQERERERERETEREKSLDMFSTDAIFFQIFLICS
jgi:hypothetical protein